MQQQQKLVIVFLSFGSRLIRVNHYSMHSQVL